MKYKLLVPIALTLIFFSCNSSNPNSDTTIIPDVVKEEVVRELTPEELQAQLKQKECDEATNYLEGRLGYSPIYKGLLSTKVIGINLKCTISNTASIATFKNMVAHVTFVSKTDAPVVEEDVNIYEFVQPNGTIVYKGEIDCTNQEWKDIADVKWNFKSAECK
jgi:hypothetical protein